MKNWILILMSFFILGIFLKGAFSQERELTFSGLILDKTKTKIGRDFYEVFVNLWEYPPGTENLNISIDEHTDPRFGTQIFVYVEDTLVYYTILKPRLEDIDAKAEEAVQMVFNYFMNYLQYQKYLEEEHKFM